MKYDCRTDIELTHKDYLNTLLSKNAEMGHVFYVNPKNHRKGKKIFKTTSTDKITKGQKMGVYTPSGIINMHTHPKVAYGYEDSILGWPSGEDMREVIRYALGGNLIHYVVALEGIYVIQVNPCFKKALTKLTP